MKFLLIPRLLGLFFSLFLLKHAFFPPFHFCQTDHKLFFCTLNVNKVTHSIGLFLLTILDPDREKDDTRNNIKQDRGVKVSNQNSRSQKKSIHSDQVGFIPEIDDDPTYVSQYM